MERAVEQDTGRRSVVGESLVSRRKMPTAEEVGDSLSRVIGGGRSRGSVDRWECGTRGKMKKALAARGADPSTGHMKVDVRGSVNFVKIQMAGSSRVRSARRANVWRRKWTGGQGGERVGEVQEIVKITVDSGPRAYGRSERRVLREQNATKTVILEAANGCPIRVEGDAGLEFVRDG